MENIEGAQARIEFELDFEECSGNGSLMRIVPVGVAYWRDVRLAREVARVQSRVTHPSLPCVEACEAYTELVCGVMNGESFDIDDIDWLPGFILMFLARPYQAAIV